MRSTIVVHRASPPSPVLRRVGPGAIAALLTVILLTLTLLYHGLGSGGESASGRAGSAAGAGATPAPAVPEAVEPGGASVPTTSPLPLARAPAAVAAVDALAAGMPGVRLAVAVFDRERGEFVPGRAAADPVYSASLVKIIVAVDMLQRQRSGGPSLRPREIDLIRRVLGPSDDRAMNQLWSRFDGIGAVQRVSGQLGLVATRQPADRSQWAETMVSAADVVTLYRHVLTGMPAADRDLIMSSIEAVPPVAADGFDQVFGLVGTGDRATVVAKQGWMCCHNGRFTLHSTGLLGAEGRYVVALLSTQPRGVGWEASRENLTAAAGALRGILG